MTIDELNEKECRDVLARTSLGRLGCSRENQPYIIPIYFAYDANYLYVLSTLGQKIEWMRENPKVCVQVDEVASNSNWVSVIANGTFHELPEPQYASERAHARKLLQARHHWWLNAMAERRTKSEDLAVEPLFFRIQIESISGLRGTPEHSD